MKIKIGLDLDGVLSFVGYHRYGVSRRCAEPLEGNEMLIQVCPMACAELRSTIDEIKNLGCDVSIIIISTWATNWNDIEQKFFETILDTKIEGCLNHNFISMDNTNSKERRYNNLLTYLKKYPDYDHCIVIDDSHVVTDLVKESAIENKITQVSMIDEPEEAYWYDKEKHIESGFSKISRKKVLDFLYSIVKIDIVV